MSLKKSSSFNNGTGKEFLQNGLKPRYVLEEKDPTDMFQEPIHIGQCPLCGGDVYSENDPSNDYTMSRRCCKCTWNDNQFMTWEEMNSY